MTTSDLPPQRSSPLAVTDIGTVRGAHRGDVAVFRGIPYAAPPVGPRRFAAPEPHASWSGVRDAVDLPATPQRRHIVDPPTIPSESIEGDDVLTVTVFAPAEPTKSCPVLFWVHGGGFIAGTPDSPWFDGTAFARAGIVVVAASYRLGFEGFGWLEDAPANRGLLDLEAALGWVGRNIAGFGGDPSAVTVAGQSAGGGAVLALMSSPRIQSLFRSAIAVSPGPVALPVDTAEGIGRALATRAGVAPTSAGWAAVDRDTVLDLQYSHPALLPDGTPTDTLTESLYLSAGEDDGLMHLPFGPTLDGDLLQRSPVNALRNRIGTDKSLLIGSTAEEFVGGAADDPTDARTAIGLTEAGMPRRHIDSARSRSTLHGGSLETWAKGDVFFRRPVVTTADAHAAAGGRTWLYDFAWRSPVSGRAAHCVDLPFAWDSVEAEGVREALGENLPAALRDAVHGAWKNFITAGDPGWESTVPGSSRRGMLFDHRGGTVNDLYRELG